MEQADDNALRMLAALLDGAHLAAPDKLPDVIAAAAAEIGWTATLYAVDYAQDLLLPMPASNAPARSPESVDGTVAGRAFRRVEPSVGVSNDTGVQLWVAVIDGVERLGVLDIGLPAGSSLDDVALRDRVRWFAHLVGHLVAGKSEYGDALQRTRLTNQRTVASELIWSLLPPLTMACTGLVIAGVLEPSHAVAGDVFDYAVHDGVADIAIVDATGHDIRSGVIGALTLAAYRNGRRRQLRLTDAMQLIDATLSGYEEDTYATGVFGRLVLETGRFEYLNAGHPSPLLLRHGRVVKSLDGGRRPLFGLPNVPVEAGTGAFEQLEPGDWVVLYTDGVTEARDPVGTFFGLDRFVDVIERCAADQLTAPETIRRIVHAILDHQKGVLQDDATLLVVQWKTGHELDLTAS